ncbi:MAG TPA: Uma2 family endonuclease [Chloroflexota bacterium]|nr:Uma2 family endonuclease [Chloroflexota bacterium]
MSTTTHATVDDLYRVKGKAELVNGRLQIMEPTGDMPSLAGLAIVTSLRAYQKKTGTGIAYPDNAAFLVDLPNRQSFSPDAAYHIGKRTGMKFLDGAPVFASEVRSEHDYGPAAEAAMRQKRADYFAAGTLVVWDVDLLAEDIVRVYRATDPEYPTRYRRGEYAEAEPAVPGWRMLVDELFE